MGSAEAQPLSPLPLQITLQLSPACTPSQLEQITQALAACFPMATIGSYRHARDRPALQIYCAKGKS